MRHYPILFLIPLFLTACGQDTQVIQGPKGDHGEAGRDGQDAEIESIALCPELRADEFQEYLLRINGQLYGVYFDHSAKKTFLTQLRPGHYTTTDGRRCEFTVDENGNIT